MRTATRVEQRFTRLGLVLVRRTPEEAETTKLFCNVTRDARDPIPMPDCYDQTIMNCVFSGVPRLMCLFLGMAAASVSAVAQTTAATEYRFTFPDAIHHVVTVEATFHNVPMRPLEVQLSRSSPGRYAAFEFGSNVFEERFTDGNGKPLTVTKTNPRSWQVSGHNGTVHVTYKLFGDRVDGTFFAIDSTHAHFNWPATVMWAHGFDDRPWRITFSIPTGSDWKIATQLYPTADAQTFTAPNLQYLMDSPAELSNFAMATFTIPPIDPAGKTETIRVTAHSQATAAEFNDYVAGAHKIVLEEQAVYGELPHYEPGYYTFLSDALPWDNGDGMEHRNSTVITGRALNLGTVAHEYFHNWNVERIRPEGLEPFNFADVNMSGEMFIAEGFTQYYGALAMVRSGLSPLPGGLRPFAGSVTAVMQTPGAAYRSPMDMSRLAPFVDGASDLFPTYFNNDFLSYYTFGEAVAMGLDLELRARTDSRVTLDDFMRAMWLAYGKPGGPQPGLVGKPYTIDDVQKQLAIVSGDPKFAADFVTKYMKGTDKIDYAPLFLRAGLILRKQDGPATLGAIRLQKQDNALVVAASTLIGSPAYNAGLDRDDELVSVAGMPTAAPGDLPKALLSHKAGDTVELVFRRRGQEVHATATLAEPSQLELVPVESTGATLSPAQKTFRDAWLNSKVKQ